MTNPPASNLCFSFDFVGGTTRAQWEDVTGSTPLTFVNDCVNFTTTVSARFWLMDCRNVSEATKMATELYREAIHVPFMAKYVHCIYIPKAYYTLQIFFRFFVFSHHFIVLILVAKKWVFVFSHHFATKVSNKK